MTSDVKSIVGSQLTEPHVVSFLERFTEHTERFDETCEDGQFHLISYRHGWETFVRDELVVSLWLHSGVEPDFDRYATDLPYNICFDDSRDAARAKHGVSNHSDIHRAHRLAHDVFVIDDFRVTLYYTHDFLRTSYMLVNRP